MRRQPRARNESIFAGGMAWGIVLVGLLIGVATLAFVAVEAWKLFRRR